MRIYFCHKTTNSKWRSKGGTAHGEPQFFVSKRSRVHFKLVWIKGTNNKWSFCAINKPYEFYSIAVLAISELNRDIIFLQKLTISIPEGLINYRFKGISCCIYAGIPRPKVGRIYRARRVRKLKYSFVTFVIEKSHTRKFYFCVFVN